ncbi:serine/threonine-protein kinase [Actinomycetospora callitridis]|uniref:serine/threonine-protein kinase n=1 Tax=Actinomycetospora callitridis TaxID=913944 RepID=UPI002365E5F7|nr:serine/threonine-protein kinase [Actinomycetospora callitridis]MDD7918270.1 serine/threonine-protein kinase [Actinomycetospora callitridis]
MADEGELIAERYRVRTRVGQGAMGVVWRAEDERLRREVALKQVWLPAGADDEARDQAHRRVFREARMIARLHHPHAITVFDVVEHDGGPWLVMEYLASRSLAEVLVADGALGPERVARVGRQVAAALAAAHDAGIVHRDVKPGNVLLAADGRAKVTDFGIARAVDDVTITSTGMMAGTPAYLAPEVARGAHADFRSDVYSLGSTLYAALEGAPPFGSGDNPLAVLHRVASGDYAPPTPRGPITPLVERLLRAEPAQRPDMHQARDELARLVWSGTEGPITPFLTRPGPDAASDGSAAGRPVSSPVSATTSPPAPNAAPAPAPGPPSVPPSAPPSVPPGAPAGPPPGTRPGTVPAAPPAFAASAIPLTASTSAPNAPRRRDVHAARSVAALPARARETGPAMTAPVSAPEEVDSSPDGAPARGRRWPWVAAATAIVAVVAVIVVAALLGTTGDQPGASVPGNTAAPDAGSGSASTQAAGSGTDGADDTGGSDGPVALSGSPDDQARQQALVNYYGLLPNRLDEGWQRLTPSFQRSTAGGFDNYRAFWGSMSQVTVRGVSPSGGDEVDATVTYRYANGREVDERTVFRMVFVNSIWKIDGQRRATG